MKVLFNAWQKSFKAARKKGAVNKTLCKSWAVIKRLLPLTLLASVAFLLTEQLAAFFIRATAGSTLALGFMVVQSLARPLAIIAVVVAASDTKRRSWITYLKAAALFVTVQSLLFGCSMLFLAAQFGHRLSIWGALVRAMFAMHGSTGMTQVVLYTLSFAVCGWVYDGDAFWRGLVDGWRFFFMELPYLLMATVWIAPLYLLTQPAWHPRGLWLHPLMASRVAGYLFMFLAFLWQVTCWAVWIRVYYDRQKAVRIKARSIDALQDEY